MQTSPATTITIRDYDTLTSASHVVPVLYPETANALKVMVAHIDAQINHLWHYGSHGSHRIGEVREMVAGIIAQTRLITILTGDYPHSERVVYALRSACLKAEKSALARLRK